MTSTTNLTTRLTWHKLTPNSMTSTTLQRFNLTLSLRPAVKANLVLAAKETLTPVANLVPAAKEALPPALMLALMPIALLVLPQALMLALPPALMLALPPALMLVLPPTLVPAAKEVLRLAAAA